MRQAAAWAGAAALLLVLPACSRSTSNMQARRAPPVHLSMRSPDGNAAAVVDFVRKVCIDAIGNPDAIAQAIAAQRWPAEDGAAGAGQMVTVRDLEHGRIAYSAIPFAAPGGQFSDCQLELDGSVAPGLAHVAPLIARALQPVSPRRTQNGPDRFAWSWRTAPNSERELTLAASAPARQGARPGLTVHVSSAEYTLGSGASPPLEELPPPANGSDAGAAPPAPPPAPAVAPPPPLPSGNAIGNGQ
jgi:hypothetical protein